MSNFTKNSAPRSPVVVIMGHIDHGKSTLLDYIRKTSTALKEAGGITQHISAYEAECGVSGEKRTITFLDTPGHEAFSSVRERGVRVADIAVLVVSAEDGVKPQTLEALNVIQKFNLPFIIAINKIDKPGANADRVKQNLAEHSVLVEGWGGTTPVVQISAKTGENVNDLLEMIALQADVEELRGDPTLPAEGFVIESDLNPKQGIRATLIIKNGSLKLGSFVYTNWAWTKVRMIENYKGESIKEAKFSSPVRIVGWSDTPSVGSKFHTFLTKEEGETFATTQDEHADSKNETIKESTNSISLILKADTFGSLDAIQNELQKLSTEKMGVKIIGKGIGDISEQDIKTAMIKKNLILGFSVGMNKGVDMLALRSGIELKTFNIIYELLDFVKAKIQTETPFETKEVITGMAKILRNFSKTKDKQVIGARVQSGEIHNNKIVKIIRREVEIGEGKIKEIQSQKIKTDSVKEGDEFGMMLESKMDVVPGDILQEISKIQQQ